MPKPPSPQPVALRVELLDVAPLVWRRVLVSNHWNLASLHHYLQWIMGWTDSHAHEFQVGDIIVAPEWWISEVGQSPDVRTYKDERRVSVASVVGDVGASGEFGYVYDMGDDWRHWIVVEPLPERRHLADVPLPMCLPVRTLVRPRMSVAREAMQSSWKRLAIGGMTSTKTC